VTLELRDRLAALREMHARLIRETDMLLHDFDSDKILQENARLKHSVDEYRHELAEIKKQREQLVRENEYLRMALKEQIWDEKRNILKVSRQKLATYFSTQAQGFSDGLSELELKARLKVEQIKSLALRNLSKEHTELNQKIAQLEEELSNIVQQQEAEYKQQTESLFQEVSEKLDSMRDEDVSPETMKQRIKENRLEMKVGLNLINKVGVFLILLGVATAFSYSFKVMGDMMKACCFLLLGLLMSGGGEWLYRKGQKVFSLGLIGGGVSVLYGTIFFSYFADIIRLEAGLLFCVLVTATTAVLSLRYNSRTVCALALIGGYLPFVTFVAKFSLDQTGFTVAMGYLFLLHLLVLSLSLSRRWTGIHWLSFILNIPALVFLAFSHPEPHIGMVYSFVVFVMYLAITLAFPIRYQVGLRALDLILLGLNTFVGAVLIYILMNEAGYEGYHGLLTMGFCLAYWGLGRFTQRFLRSEEKTWALFYLTALTFAILIIPFQFEVHWLSLGWLIEGTLFITYGSKQRQRAVEVAGWCIFLLCQSVFYLTEFLPKLAGIDGVQYFTLKHTTIIIVQVLVLIHYLRRKHKGKVLQSSTEETLIKVYKYMSIVAVWFYLLYSIPSFFSHWAPQIEYSRFYATILTAMATIGLGLIITRVSVVKDTATSVMGIFLQLFGVMICLTVNLFVPVLRPLGEYNSLEQQAAFVAMVGFNALAFFIVRDLLKQLVDKKGMNWELVPLGLGLYLLGNINAFLIVQFHLGELNFIISFVFLLLSLAYIIYGFVCKTIYLRRLGLGLALTGTAKLFLYDLAYLEALGRIVAYFGFGIMLILISYIYQRVKNSMEGNHESKSV
jgi:hypothetical protein